MEKLSYCKNIFRVIKIIKYELNSIMFHQSKFFHSSNCRKIFNNLLLKERKIF